MNYWTNNYLTGQRKINLELLFSLLLLTPTSRLKKVSRRLEILRETIGEGFLCGVSLMPLIPYITDTTENLYLFFSTFKTYKVHYVLPASITLYGTGPPDSMTLMMNVITKQYPQLEGNYFKLFKDGPQMPLYYQNCF